MFVDGLHIFDSQIPGSITLLVGLVHGNEPVGLQFLDQLQKAFDKKLFSGKILFLLANIEAYNQSKRFVDQDLNRSFGVYDYSNSEINRAEELKAFFRNFETIDYVFDIHSTPTKSDPMMICTPEQASLELTKYFPIRRVICGLTELIEGVSLTKYLSAAYGVKNIAFECGQHDDPNMSNLVKSIFDTILQIHATGSSKTEYVHDAIQVIECIRTRSKEFQFMRDFQGFENICADEIIAKEPERTLSYAHETIMVIPRPDALGELGTKDEVIVGYIGKTIAL